MKPTKKSKPPPLVLCNTEAQYWPLPSPLAEFAAIATSPESPLVKEMSWDNMSVSNAFKVRVGFFFLFLKVKLLTGLNPLIVFIL